MVEKAPSFSDEDGKPRRGTSALLTEPHLWESPSKRRKNRPPRLHFHVPGDAPCQDNDAEERARKSDPRSPSFNFATSAHEMAISPASKRTSTIMEVEIQVIKHLHVVCVNCLKQTTPPSGGYLIGEDGSESGDCRALIDVLPARSHLLDVEGRPRLGRRRTRWSLCLTFVHVHFRALLVNWADAACPLDRPMIRSTVSKM